MKRILYLALLFTLITGSIPMQAGAQATYTSGIYTYTISNNQATITACSNQISGSLTLPSMLGGYAVTGIGIYAFLDCTKLTGILIPDSIVTIERYAFKGCNALSEITFPNHLIRVSMHAFHDTAWFQNESGDYVIGGKVLLQYKGLNQVVDIPEGVVTIGDYAFEANKMITGITLPSSVKYIGGNAFQQCIALTEITIPSSVTNIGRLAFAECKGLTSIIIPNSVRSIGESAFIDCHSLTDITMPDSLDLLDVGVFYNCYSLTGVKIPKGITSIKGAMFAYCRSLTSIEIPNGVSRIEDFVFFNCYNLTSLKIPKTVAAIGNYVFWGCNQLSLKLYPSSYAQGYAISKGMSYHTIQAAVLSCPPTDQNGMELSSERLQSITEVRLDMKIDDYVQSPILLISFYDNQKRMLSMLSYQAESGRITLPISSVPQGAVKMKVFCWDGSMDSLMMPYEI